MEQLVADHVDVVHQAVGTRSHATDPTLKRAEQSEITQPCQRASGDAGTGYRRVIGEVECSIWPSGQELVLGNRSQYGQVSFTQPLASSSMSRGLHALLAAPFRGCGARMGTIIRGP